MKCTPFTVFTCALVYLSFIVLCANAGSTYFQDGGGAGGERTWTMERKVIPPLSAYTERWKVDGYFDDTIPLVTSDGLSVFAASSYFFSDRSGSNQQFESYLMKISTANGALQWKVLLPHRTHQPSQDSSQTITHVSNPSNPVMVTTNTGIGRVIIGTDDGSILMFDPTATTANDALVKQEAAHSSPYAGSIFRVVPTEASMFYARYARGVFGYKVDSDGGNFTETFHYDTGLETRRLTDCGVYEIKCMQTIVPYIAAWSDASFFYVVTEQSAIMADPQSDPNGLTYVINGNYTIDAVDGSTGVLKWRQGREGSRFLQPSLVSSTDELYAPTADGLIYRINATSGDVYWGDNTGCNHKLARTTNELVDAGTVARGSELLYGISSDLSISEDPSRAPGSGVAVMLGMRYTRSVRLYGVFSPKSDYGKCDRIFYKIIEAFGDFESETTQQHPSQEPERGATYNGPYVFIPDRQYTDSNLVAKSIQAAAVSSMGFMAGPYGDVYALRLPLTQISATTASPYDPGVVNHAENYRISAAYDNVYDVRSSTLAAPAVSDGWFIGRKTLTRVFQTGNQWIDTSRVVSSYISFYGCDSVSKGATCSVCVDKHFLLDGTCRPCPSNSLTIYIMLFAFLFLALILMAKFGSITKSLSPIAQLINFSQIISIMIVLNIEWPPLVLQMLNIFSLANLNLGVAGPECEVPELTWEIQQLALLGFPLVLGLVLSISVFGVWLFTKCKCARDVTLTNTISGAVRTAVLFSKLAFLTYVIKAIQLVACIGFPGAAVDGTTQYRLRWRQDVVCFESYHIAMFIMAIFAFLLYVLAPLIVFAVKSSPTHKSAQNEVFEVRFGSLWATYHFNVRWWELTVLLRKMLLAVVALFLASDPTIGTGLCAAAVLLVLVGTLIMRPFRQNDHNVLEIILLTVNVLFMGLGLLTTKNGLLRDEWKGNVWIDVISISLSVIAVLATVVVIVKSILYERKLAKERTKKYKEGRGKSKGKSKNEVMEFSVDGGDDSLSAGEQVEDIGKKKMRKWKSHTMGGILSQTNHFAKIDRQKKVSFFSVPGQSKLPIVAGFVSIFCGLITAGLTVSSLYMRDASTNLLATTTLSTTFIILGFLASAVAYVCAVWSGMSVRHFGADPSLITGVRRRLRHFLYVFGLVGYFAYFSIVMVGTESLRADDTSTSDCQDSCSGTTISAYSIITIVWSSLFLIVIIMTFVDFIKSQRSLVRHWSSLLQNVERKMNEGEGESGSGQEKEKEKVVVDGEDDLTIVRESGFASLAQSQSQSESQVTVQPATMIEIEDGEGEGEERVDVVEMQPIPISNASMEDVSETDPHAVHVPQRSRSARSHLMAAMSVAAASSAAVKDRKHRNSVAAVSAASLLAAQAKKKREKDGKGKSQGRARSSTMTDYF